MKLKNKKTGEIVETDYMFGVSIPTTETFGCKSYDQIAAYSSLAALNAEWEDYHEESKGYWYYDTTVNRPDFIENCNVAKEDKKLDKQIGNYFETKEEAEKAVEKLKAWKRLKEAGLRFKTYSPMRMTISYGLPDCDDEYEVEKDLDLLFGGEE